MILVMAHDYTPPVVPGPWLGTWPLSGAAPWGYGPCTPKMAAETIETALEMGCRGFDTASLFGDGAVEKRLGAMLSGMQDIHLTTRVGCRMENNHPVSRVIPEQIAQDAQEACERLGRTPDLLLLFTPSPAVLRDGQAVQALIKLKAEGVANAVGVSVFEPDEALMAMAAGVDWVCVPYNPANRKMERLVFAEAARLNVRVHARELLHNGLLTDSPRHMNTLHQHDVRREWPASLWEKLGGIRERMAAAVPELGVTAAAIGYGLGHPVAAASVGCRGAAQVRAALGGEGGLSEDQRERINTALYGVSDSLGGGAPPSQWHSASMRSISASFRP